MIHFLLRNMGKLRTLFVALGLLGLLGNVYAASAQTGRGPYLLGPGDVVSVSVFRQPDLDLQARIQSDFSILVPVVGRIIIGGMSTQDAAIKIQVAMSEGQIIRDPAVVMHVVSFNSKRVAVLGFVKNPGSITLDRPSFISDVLASAGGATADGADFLVFSDFDEMSGNITRHELLIDDVLGTGDANTNRQVGDRDIIYVPRAPVYYIYGDVRNAGSFRLQPEMTVEEALANAGGVTELGDRDKIRRRDNSGSKSKLVRVDLTEIVEAGDVLYVGHGLF